MQETDYLFGDDWPPPPPQGGGPAGVPLTEWGQLAAGKTLGKALMVEYISTAPLTAPGATNMFQIQAPDENALQLSVLLSPPKFYPGTFVQGQVVTGTIDNAEMLAQNVFKRLACPFVILEWGIGGVSNKAEIDVNNGLAVNINGSWVRISAAIETPQALTNSLQYEIAAFIGPGRPKDINAQRTVNFQSVLAATLSPIAALPRFAKRAYVLGPTTFGNVFVCDIIYYRDKNGLAPICRQFFSGNSSAPLPIPNGAYFFSIQPQDESVVSVVFELAI